jgi:N-acetylneuraminic acid mutarotase
MSYCCLVSLNVQSQSVHWKRVGKPSKNTSEYVKGDVEEGQSFIAARAQECRWADSKGNLWVFSGMGYDTEGQYGIFQDLWKYEPKSDTWQLVKGKGNKTKKEKEENWPEGRRSASTWCDKNGNLWLFGGRGTGDLFHFNDMWVFDVNREQWRKIAGNENLNEKPTYRKANDFSKTYSPGGRSESSTWTDSDNNLWLFGGGAFDGKSEVFYNDLWQFDVKREEWRNVSGSEKVNQVLDSTSHVVSENSALPSSRRDAISWYDKKNNQLWLYGGLGLGLSVNQVGGLADMWVFNIKENSWKIKSRRYSINGEPENFSAGGESPKNSPGGRNAATSWVDRSGYLYLMGGRNVFYTGGTFVDSYIWRYNTQKEAWTIVPGVESVGIGGGTVFTAANGITYLYGGREFDMKKRQSYSVNSIWLLEEK